MTTLDQALLAFTQLFERMNIRYALMGGLAVRVHGIPRPTHDVDVTIAIERDQLTTLYDGAEALGFTVPEAYRRGWVDQVAGMPIVKFRMFLERHGIDIDLFLAESPFQERSRAPASPWRHTARQKTGRKRLRNARRNLNDASLTRQTDQWKLQSRASSVINGDVSGWSSCELARRRKCTACPLALLPIALNRIAVVDYRIALLPARRRSGAKRM